MKNGAEYRRLRPASNFKWEYRRSRTQKALTIPAGKRTRCNPVSSPGGTCRVRWTSVSRWRETGIVAPTGATAPAAVLRPRSSAVPHRLLHSDPLHPAPSPACGPAARRRRRPAANARTRSARCAAFHRTHLALPELYYRIAYHRGLRPQGPASEHSDAESRAGTVSRPHRRRSKGPVQGRSAARCRRSPRARTRRSVGSARCRPAS